MHSTTAATTNASNLSQLPGQEAIAELSWMQASKGKNQKSFTDAGTILTRTWVPAGNYVRNPTCTAKNAWSKNT